MTFTPRQLAITLGVALALVVFLLLQWLIVTDKDRIKLRIREMRCAVEEAQPRRLMDSVSRDYEDKEFTREDLLGAAFWFAERYGPVAISIRETRIRIVGARAVAVVSVTVQDTEGETGLLGRSVWRFDFIREIDGQWRLSGLTPMRFGVTDVQGWSDVYSMFGMRTRHDATKPPEPSDRPARRKRR